MKIFDVELTKGNADFIKEYLEKTGELKADVKEEIEQYVIDTIKKEMQSN